MLQLDSIDKNFGQSKIISGLSLKVETGERVAIIGESGCGKSTILKIISGLIEPDFGKVSIQNPEMNIGFLFQNAALFDSLTVYENVAFVLLESATPPPQLWIKRKVEEMLACVELEGFESKMPHELSGGQRKRVALARALTANPQLMLYDEPTTGLDPILSTNIENLIIKLADHFSITTIVVTHQISTMMRTAKKIYLMSNGGLSQAETPESMANAKGEIGNFFRGGLSCSSRMWQ